LQQTLGEEVVELHPPRSLEDASLEACLRPRDGDELARSLAALSEQELSVLVQGGGSRMQLGNPCPRARALLSTQGLVGIDEFDSNDGVVLVRAGTPLSLLAETVDQSGWQLPFDPPGPTTTVGGALATSATGPRRQQFGSPRDSVLGLQVVLSSGQRTRCGGRVVKNVTGYDMAKLYTGSFGSLGVIEATWLRLRPRPRVATVARAELRGPASESLRLGREVSRRGSARVVALVAGGPAAQLGEGSELEGSGLLVVEYAGDVPEVERDIAWLQDQCGAREVSEESRLVERLRALQGAGAIRARLSVLPSRLPALLARLSFAGLGTITYPGLGVVYAFSESGATAILRAARASDAELLFEALPLASRREVDVFGEPGPAFPIARALKQRFDPSGILNPGRFQGRL
jgi:glycolate oxidase FAD binding subunit